MEQILNEKDDLRLREACRDFESVFFNEMFKAMRKTIPKNNLWGGGFAEGTFQSMLDEEYANQMAMTQSTGIARMIYDQFIFNISLAN